MSSVPIKQEAIVDSTNVSHVKGPSGEMDSISICRHEIPLLAMPTNRDGQAGEDIEAQSGTQDGLDHASEMATYIKDSSAE